MNFMFCADLSTGTRESVLLKNQADCAIQQPGSMTSQETAQDLAYNLPDTSPHHVLGAEGE